MIQAILSFQFELNQNESGDIEPDFNPIELIFVNKDFNVDDYSALIDISDIFGIFYQHSAGSFEVSKEFGNFQLSKLKKTPYQAWSYFMQEAGGVQTITILIFELDDELELFEDLIKQMGNKLHGFYKELVRAKKTKRLSAIEKANYDISNQLKLTQFHVDRLSNLDKLQKVGLIYKSKERLEILNSLRERPHSKMELKKKIELMNRDANIDILLEPFIELNLIRRDWIKGDERDKEKGIFKNQGEFLFLVKDITLSRVPNEHIIKLLTESENKLFYEYRKKMRKFIQTYKPNNQTIEETVKLANFLLNPDEYDFFNLMKTGFYPLEKIPKILSEWADREKILAELEELDIITILHGKKKKEWVVLFNDIQPLIFWPEYLLPRIRRKYKLKEITWEVAKKALDLLEVTYVEKIEL